MSNDKAQQGMKPEDISLTELTAFAHGNKEYPALWHRYINKQTSTCGFNFWAALFGTTWFVFHKMYIVGAAVLLIDLALFFVAALAGPHLVPASWAATNAQQTMASLGVLIVGRVAIGYWANIALCQKAVRDITRIDALNVDNDMHLKLIGRAGTASLVPVFALIAASFVLRVVAGY